jgi:hypothetical protein
MLMLWLFSRVLLPHRTGYVHPPHLTSGRKWALRSKKDRNVRVKDPDMSIGWLLSHDGSHNTGYAADFDFDDVSDGLMGRIADVEPLIPFRSD